MKICFHKDRLLFLEELIRTNSLARYILSILSIPTIGLWSLMECTKEILSLKDLMQEKRGLSSILEPQ